MLIRLFKLEDLSFNLPTRWGYRNYIKMDQAKVYEEIFDLVPELWRWLISAPASVDLLVYCRSFEMTHCCQCGRLGRSESSSVSILSRINADVHLESSNWRAGWLARTGLDIEDSSQPPGGLESPQPRHGGRAGLQVRLAADKESRAPVWDPTRQSILGSVCQMNH